MEEPGRWWSASGRAFRAIVNTVLVIVVIGALLSMSQARGRLSLLPAGCNYEVDDNGAFDFSLLYCEL